MEQNKREKPIVLTIAGFDPSSGAGLTADIRTFEVVGVYGMSICTAITIQNAEDLANWQPLDKELVKKQLEIILSSYPIKIIKTGMLATEEIIKVIVEYIDKYGLKLVLDPIVISGSGKRLAEENYEDALKKWLFPRAEVITLNKYEAEYFSGKKIDDALSLEGICRSIMEMGPKNIIVKGGHLDEKSGLVVDYLYNKDIFRFYPRERVVLNNAKHIHGTGCVYSSLIAAFMALNYDLETCIFFAEDYMEEIFKKVFPLKKGTVLDVGYTQEELDVLLAIQKVVNFICKDEKFSKFIPEVRTNVAISKENATKTSDIAGVDGRVTVVAGHPVASGPIRFGATNHTGRLLLSAKKFDNNINAVINIKYNPETILKLKDTSLSIVYIDRSMQSEEIETTENKSMDWVVHEAYKKVNMIPDIIYDTGEKGKEPMIRLFGKNAEDLIKKIKLFINLT
ncbi:MAG: bifunctional hydroxymethylpyrimidine kinase/phosphomethylpyrimidine kinase [Promethearchaeota archaeon]